MADIKPWNGKRNAGKLSVHKLTVPYLIAEFKCTVYDCGFYTDTPETIKAHFETHQKPATQPAITRFSPWLECWFCKHVAPNTSDLLEHVQIAHKHCGYQCDRCCYRSRDPNSVVVHQRKYHVEQFDKAKILCVPGRQKPYTDIDDDAIMNEMKTNVKCLQCSHCSMRKFIDLDEFLTHIDGHNKTYIECHVCTELLPVQTMSEHIKLHNIYLFQCVYCDHGTIATARIMEHVTDEHPERMLFYHTRVSRVSDD
uniref:C2H2-type domain-containing protein n=1 Tax=Anopheles christyi TaxID=43041 RepID=A0A182K0R8_9DIPT